MGSYGVYLITSIDVAGREYQAVVDTGHAGLRDPVLDHLATRGLGPADIDVFGDFRRFAGSVVDLPSQ